MNITVNTIDLMLSSLIALSVISVFAAVLIDFVKFGDKTSVKRGKKSIVATGTMTAFYIIYYLMIYFKIGSVHVTALPLVILGVLCIVSGAVMNIWGRFTLSDNWANHIKIYENHALKTFGMYRIVRHPLYASIMLMLFGGSLAYRNWVSAVLTAFIFIPFMYYRAKQEETLLCKEFPEYREYADRTGMFFPKFWR